MEKSFVIRGDICWSEGPAKFMTREDSYLVCVDGLVEGVFKKLPDRFKNLMLYDYRKKLIIPGISDLHVHAPQYAYRGMHMDIELLEWLDTVTFPIESRYKNEEFAREAYSIFVEDMKRSVTTRASVFATLHVPATKILMELFEASGLVAYVGKVNMDRNSNSYLIETAEQSLEDTREWIESTADKYENVKPIITPRFIPSCTDELMRGLSALAHEKGIPVQSHLSENLGEIAWVKELCPWADSYPDAYDKFGMYGGDVKTIMAHCIHMTDDEIGRLAEQGVFVAHSPQSNENLRSGVAPIRKMLDMGAKVGLASDIAGGAHINMFRHITDAIQCSKLRWRLQDDTLPALSMREAFFLATKGGGEFFGKVGSFEKGYEFDAVVLDDSNLRTPLKLELEARLERTVYLAESGNVYAKFVRGTKLF